MSLYEEYLEEILEREKAGLSPKPIENSALINEIIANIIEKKISTEKKALSFLYIILFLGQLKQR